MRVVFPEPVSIAIFENGYYEEELTQMLMHVVKPGMTFFDVGAHFGYYSLLVSWLVGSEGSVVSFEPTPSSMAILRSNLVTAGNVRVEALAVWSSSGLKGFRDFGPKYSAFNSFFAPRLDTAHELREESLFVETTSIDEYVNRTGIRPDVMKIDAESSEMEILKGTSETLSSLRPMIAVEVGEAGVANAATTTDLVEAIRRHRYVPMIYREGAIHEVASEQIKNYQNLMFFPQERHLSN